MAKANKKKGFSLQGFDVQAYRQSEAYVQAVDALYSEAVKDFAKVASGLKFNPNKPFSFNDYPAAKRKADEIINGLSSNMKSVVVEGTKKQWLFACQKNDEFLNHILNTSKIAKKTLAKYQDKNLDALSTFQTRKVNGLDLSQRIWNYTGQMKTQMELGIDIALGDGRSANALSRDLRQYLVDPDKLYRRVRDKHGNLVLSKNAKAFHPGQGKYRSSYKNAMRLTRSEINMAYRESDQLRWDKLDFIVGYEVKLSNNHTLNGKPFVDICDDLKGKYPKTFKFTGWHPQCRCHTIPILSDPDEFNTDELNELKAAINGTEYKKFASRNTVTDVPDNFKEWVKDNAEKSKGWKSQPFFIRDNFKGGIIANGLSLNTEKQIVKTEPISERTPNVVKIQTEQRPEYKKIVEAEDKIRMNRSFETAVVFDESGNEVYRKKGAKSSVSFYDNEIQLFKNKIFTHNHTGGWKFDDNSIKRAGSSFSSNDVVTAIRSDMKEIRAVTPHYTFALKRPSGGWGMSVQAAKSAIMNIEADVRSDFMAMLRNRGYKDIDIKRAESIHWHIVWKRFSSKYNIEYTKAKTRG